MRSPRLSAAISVAGRHEISRRIVATSAGSLCALGVVMAGGAQAQAPASATAENAPGAPPSGTLSTPAATAPGATAPASAAAPSLISMKFADAPVDKLLTMIGDQGNVPYILSGDITGRKVSVSLADVTAEKAMQIVANAAGLFWAKKDGVFIFAKTKAELGDVEPEPAEPKVASGPVTNNLDPRLNMDLRNADLLPLGSGASGLAQNPLSGNANTSIRPGSTYGPDSPFPQGDSIFSLAPLANGATEQGGGKRTYNLFKMRYQKVRTVLWWIDPANNPMPLEYKASSANIENMFKKRMVESAVDPNEMAALQGYRPMTPNQYQPYAPSGTPIIGESEWGWQASAAGAAGLDQFAQPYLQNNAQFGGGRGGRGGGGGGFGGGGFGGGGRGGAQGGRGGAGGGGGGGGVFELPEGVERIVAIDPQNALLVQGTPEGIAALTQIIEFLDRPLRQVEIEAQFVEVALDATKNFGIDFSSNSGPFSVQAPGFAPGTSPGSFSLGFVRNNFQATLRALASSGRAKSVNAPRVTAINNLTASLQSFSSTPIVLASTTTGIGGQQSTAQQLFYFTTTIGLTVTPTINNDDTITVLMQPTVSLQSPGSNSVGAPNSSGQSIITYANVKDGDTIALGGLRTKAINRSGNRIPVLSNIPILGQFFRSNRASDLERELIIFLTARIIRRLEDTEPIPGV